MAPALKLLMLFIATASFAVTAAGTWFLDSLDVVVGTQSYVCDTNSGTYVAFTFDAQLFDAKQQYANNVDGLNKIISEIINYEQSGPFSDVSGYIKDRLGFKPAGQVISSGGNTEIQTYNVDTGKLELDLDFKIVEGSQSIGGLTLINGAEFVVITNPNPPASSNCTPGSSPTFTLSVVEVLTWYEVIP